MTPTTAREDLSEDWALRGCAQVEHEGEKRPSVGRIALLSRLGKGGMGVVYYGVHPRLGTEVAVKVLPRETLERDEGLARRFLREARLAARLHCDHLVGVLDVDRDEASGCHYLVMEYVRGKSAGRWLAELREAGRVGADEDAALEVCIAATKGLAAAHLEGIVHRDVKPDNVLVPADAAGGLLYAKAKLADLGLARPEAGDGSVTGADLAMGTPGYMAPEQANDARRAKKPADVFGMGATLYALLAGAPPFRGATPVEAILKTVRREFRPLREVRPDVSAATAVLVERCLAKDPAERYPDAPALLEALEVCRGALTRADADTAAAAARVADLARAAERGKPVVTDPSPRPSEPPTVAPLASGAEMPAPVAAPAAAAPPAAVRMRRLHPAWFAAAVVLLLAAGAIAAWAVTRRGGLKGERTPAAPTPKPPEKAQPATPPVPREGPRPDGPRPGPALKRLAQRAAEDFDLTGLAAEPTNFAEQQLREAVRTHESGDMLDTARIQRRLAEY